ncbi:hypothetical protein F511_25536 [Dorcoceras hygrometricum]|uniref:Uncharacterized protein n=1 Tax=Dorcoceras hygrometricum TaxID=472368 RepID=A0A2Z7A3R6_9LAMI|nr:hypothetical protein F511_25536 [Dorcoceras hygrometricum]
MKRRRVGESADGLALMTSSVTSSYSADGLREQSKESAGSLYIQTQERSDVVEEAIQSQATVHQQMLFGDSDSKTIRKIQSQATVDPVASFSVIAYPVDLEFQTQEKKKQAKYRDSTSREIQISSRKKEEVAKRCIQSQDNVPVASYSALHPVDKDISRR